MRQTLEQGLSMLSTQICPQAVDRLLKFSEMLLEKNKVMNLTAVTEPMEVVTRHFLDCAVLMPRMISGEKVLDVGTGAGFPGLPLAILCPESEFVLIDALRKRMDFLNEVIDALELKNVKAIHARAEEFAREHRGAFDCAVSRAVADLSMLSELTLPLVKTGGVFYAMKASDCAEEVKQAAEAVRILGGDPAEVIQYQVPVSEIPRAIVKIKKSRETQQNIRGVSRKSALRRSAGNKIESAMITYGNEITMGYFLPENRRKYEIPMETCRMKEGKYLSCGRFPFTFWHIMVLYNQQALTTSEGRERDVPSSQYSQYKYRPAASACKNIFDCAQSKSAA